jgi:hypothetical protein
LREQSEREHRETVARREALKEQARQLRDQGAEATGIKEPGTYPLAVIPSFAAPVTNLPEHRRRALRDHVTRLISQATAGWSPPSGGEKVREATTEPAAELAPAAQAVLGQACARCRGGCCCGGGDQAYLTVATIRRYLEAHPDQRPRDVLAAYLARVGHKTYQGSCIFHRPDGCSLPREMRSDTCNQHFCGGLKEFQRELPGTGPVRGFFASTRGGTILSAAFIDEAEVRVVRVPPATEGR